MSMTPEQVYGAAEAKYGADDVYETRDQRVFVLLVDAAEQVERELRAAGHALATARLMTFKALAGALEAREGDRRGDGDALAVSASLFGIDNAHDLATVPDGPMPEPAFGDLADIAWAYEQDIAAGRGAAMVDGAGDGTLTLAEAAGLTPRVTTLLGLMENLELRDEEQHETPAV